MLEALLLQKTNLYYGDSPEIHSEKACFTLFLLLWKLNTCFLSTHFLDIKLSYMSYLHFCIKYWFNKILFMANCHSRDSSLVCVHGVGCMHQQTNICWESPTSHIAQVMGHRPSNGFDRASYTCLSLPHISLSFWVSIWFLTWYQSGFCGRPIHEICWACTWGGVLGKSHIPHRPMGLLGLHIPVCAFHLSA